VPGGGAIHLLMASDGSRYAVNASICTWSKRQSVSDGSSVAFNANPIDSTLWLITASSEGLPPGLWSRKIRRLRQRGQQHSQAALGPPGASAPGGSSRGSCRMTTSTHSQKAWTDKWGHASANNENSLSIVFDLGCKRCYLCSCHSGRLSSRAGPECWSVFVTLMRGLDFVATAWVA